MKPSELAQYRFSGTLPSPVELDGTLIASGDFSHLVDDASFSPEPRFGVLLPEGFIDRLSHLEIPIMVGTSVNFVGQATFVCEVWPTGYQMLPYRMTEVYEFTYQDEHVGKHHFRVTGIPHDIYIHAPADLTAHVLTAIQPLFERSYTVIGLKKHLLARGWTLLHRALSGDRLGEVQEVLQGLGIAYELRRVPKGIEWRAQQDEYLA